MNPLRQAKIEELEALKRQLLQEQVVSSPSIDELASFYGEATEPSQITGSMDSMNPAKMMTKAMNGMAAQIYPEVPRNGFVDACVLAGLTLLFQMFFLFVSYLVFR